MYTILVVDNEKLAREDIIYKVGASGTPFDWIMEASDAYEAMEIIKTNHPDILVTDVLLGGDKSHGIKDGIELRGSEENKSPYGFGGCVRLSRFLLRPARHASWGNALPFKTR